MGQRRHRPSRCVSRRASGVSLDSCHCCGHDHYRADSSLLRSNSTWVSGRGRLVRSSADRVSDTGARSCSVSGMPGSQVSGPGSVDLGLSGPSDSPSFLGQPHRPVRDQLKLSSDRETEGYGSERKQRTSAGAVVPEFKSFVARCPTWLNLG